VKTKRLNPKERDALVQKILLGKIKAVSESHTEFEAFNSLDDNIKSSVNAIFESKSYGFREIVLTCLVAWEAGIDFDPRSDFYKCNPRSIFEKGIRPALEQNGIPHMKSGPLNVAKGAKKIDSNWAMGKKPASAAEASVTLISWIMLPKVDFDDKRIRLFTVFVEKLLSESKRLSSYFVEARSDLSVRQIHDLICKLIQSAPDLGNTPQKVVGLILVEIYKHSNCQVFHEGRACETNLTSKKPADAWVQFPNGGMVCLYEVTVKPIDINRINDSFTSVYSYGKGHNEVVWLCRLPEDISHISLNENYCIENKGIRNEFIDIKSWILVSLQIIGASGRTNFLTSLSGYISLASTSEKTKSVWQSLLK